MCVPSVQCTSPLQEAKMITKYGLVSESHVCSLFREYHLYFRRIFMRSILFPIVPHLIYYLPFPVRMSVSTSSSARAKIRIINGLLFWPNVLAMAQPPFNHWLAQNSGASTSWTCEYPPVIDAQQLHRSLTNAEHFRERSPTSTAWISRVIQ